jgi:hypothetical protein
MLKRVTPILLVSALVLLAGAAGASAHASLRDVRHSTAKFRHLAVAKHSGYGLLKDAAGIACIANPGVGGMGVDYVSGALVGDAKLNPRKPEVLVYQPIHHLRLVAVEYVVFQAAWDAAHPNRKPELFGRKFELLAAGNRYGLPAFYELHAWIWKHNPRGMFDDWNPRVHCPAYGDGVTRPARAGPDTGR